LHGLSLPVVTPKHVLTSLTVVHVDCVHKSQKSEVTVVKLEKCVVFCARKGLPFLSAC
jgi:hypothetical protein